MKILVTGSQGFIGKNLIAELRNRGCTDILEYDVHSDQPQLDEYTGECDFVFHLAGVNRPQEDGEYDTGNRGFTEKLFGCLQKHKNISPVVITSTTQADTHTPYGISKKAAEDIAFAHAKNSGARIMVYRLPNVFGKWCRPNYNSAVTTFCYNVAHNLPIQLNPTNPEITLSYIDDVVKEFISALEGDEHYLENGFCFVPESYSIHLKEIVYLLQLFKNSRKDLSIPDMSSPFVKKLYATYLSYLPSDQFSYPLKMNIDSRGSFTEFIKTIDRGQVSVNVCQPNVTKGNHWHHTKNEKFLVINGVGLIRFRKIDSNEIIEYHVSGGKLEVVDIPPGYTHNISNLGETLLITIMWANETYNPEQPDTYYMEV